jgi:hypothetical protein
VICPKCGFEQPAALECTRCGVVFQKYRAPGGASPGVLAPSIPSIPSIPSNPRNPSILGIPGIPSIPSGGAPASPVGHLYEGPIAPGGPAPAGAAALPPTERQRIKELLRTQWTFSQEELLRDTLTIFASNVVPFSVLTILVLVPEVALTRYVVSQLAEGRSLSLWAGIAALVGSLLAIPVATGTFTYGVLQEMRGERPSILACLGTGVRSLFRILLVAILQGVIVLAGTVLCILPGIVLFVTLYVAVPATVEERLGPLAALRRSARLTQGYRMHILYLLGKLLVLQWLVNFGLAFVLDLMNAQEWAKVGVSFLVGVLSVGLGATATAVTYYRLRMSKEGIDAGDIVSVFD